MNKEEFKIGDWVYIKEAYVPKNIIGTVQQITKIENNEITVTNSKSVFSIDSQHIHKFIRHATPQEIEKVEGFKLPEVWHLAVTKENISTLEEWRTSGSMFNGGYILSGNHPSLPSYYKYHIGYKVSHAPSNSTEITFEQFKKYVLKETNTTVMKAFPITRSQFQSIYDIACSTWKNKIASMVQEKLGTFGTECELDYETVKSMFDAASVTQKETLVKIFPNYSNEETVLEVLGCSSLQEVFNKSIIQIRSGEYKDKSFYLSGEWEWEIKTDRNRIQCLIPTRK